MSLHTFSHYETAAAITPSDTAVLNVKALLVGGAGALVIEPAQGGNTITITATAGQYIPVSAKRVLATGTVATGIVGLS
jgi:hypothetical protein